MASEASEAPRYAPDAWRGLVHLPICQSEVTGVQGRPMPMESAPTGSYAPDLPRRLGIAAS
jgi:hypothetical protein